MLEVNRVDQHTGDKLVTIKLPARAWIALYRLLRPGVRDEAIWMTRIIVMLAGRHLLLKHQEAIRSDEDSHPVIVNFLGDLASNETHQEVAQFIDEVHNLALALWRDEEEIVLDTTYKALSDGRLDHLAAARVASTLLGIPVTATAWRLRVARWAKKTGRDPVKQPRGGDRKSQSSDAE